MDNDINILLARLEREIEQRVAARLRILADDITRGLDARAVNDAAPGKPAAAHCEPRIGRRTKYKCTCGKCATCGARRRYHERKLGKEKKCGCGKTIRYDSPHDTCKKCRSKK